jgi:ligand-binding sensor domain-containing protein
MYDVIHLSKVIFSFRLLLIIFFPIVLPAQQQPLKFQHIPLEDGHGFCILQDSKGFMWFGTRDGLNKYDGYTFTNYKILQVILPALAVILSGISLKTGKELFGWELSTALIDSTALPILSSISKPKKTIR